MPQKEHDRILPGIEKSSMKSLFFPIIFEFCFVIKLAGTKTVPTDEILSSGRSQNKACHGRPLSSYSYRIRFALSKERKSCVGLRNLLITGFPKCKASGIYRKISIKCGQKRTADKAESRSFPKIFPEKG